MATKVAGASCGALAVVLHPVNAREAVAPAARRRVIVFVRIIASSRVSGNQEAAAESRCEPTTRGFGDAFREKG